MFTFANHKQINDFIVMAEMKVFSGTNSRYVALKIAEKLGVELGKLNISHFADGEYEVCYEEPVRGAEVYLVQSTFKASMNSLNLYILFKFINGFLQ